MGPGVIQAKPNLVIFQDETRYRIPEFMLTYGYTARLQHRFLIPAVPSKDLVPGRLGRGGAFESQRKERIYTTRPTILTERRKKVIVF